MRTFKPGEIFDNQYQLIKLLDTGGFADVWQVKHLSANNHVVALKIYPMLDEEGVRSIEIEYDVQKDLSHSNIITAKHFGKDEHGYPYIVMKYCNQGNASGRILKCDEKEIAKIIQQVSSGLVYLHEEESVVHQDMKPNNILIDEKDGKETYYLADLGLSLKVRNTIRKFTENKRENISSIQTGLTPPPYRAPELWERGNLHEQPLWATDVWAFGATLFELITGKTPFGEFGGLMQKNDPIPPDLPAEYKMSGGLNALIKACMARDTWARPTAKELLSWSREFQATGSWNIPPKYVSLFKLKPEGSTGKHKAAGGATMPSGSGGVANAEKSKANSGILKWVVVMVVGFAAAFAISSYLDSQKLKAGGERGEETILFEPRDPDGQKVKDTPESSTRRGSNAVDTLAIDEAAVDTVDAGVGKESRLKEKSAGKGFAITDEGEGTTGKASPAKPVAKPEFATLTYPSIVRKPRASCINIAEIRRSEDQIIVKFVLCNEGKEEAGYTIYGSGEYAFVLEANGRHYKLRSISPSGQGRIRPSGTLTVKAVFDGVPSRINKVNILEGTDQTRKEQNNWNFFGVQLPNL